MSLIANVFFGAPGIGATHETIESEVTWGEPIVNGSFIVPSVIAASAVDSGNTPTTLIRPGMLMGNISGTKEWLPWDDAATDGSEVLKGVLLYSVGTQQFGAGVQRYLGAILISGQVKASKLLKAGNANYGIDGDVDEAAIRAAMALRRFELDDAIYQ